MQKPDPTMFILQKMISDLTKVERNHRILDSEKAENDVEHSYAVSMLCWYIYEKLNLTLDISKILKYALIHDFVEVYAGDVNTFASTQERNSKIKQEAMALDRLISELSGFKNMRTLLVEYESRVDEESKFVWTVDKMQSLILGELDEWRPYRDINVTYASFTKKHAIHLESGSAFCKEIFRELLEYCKTTYYDQPNKKGSPKTS